MIGWAAQSCLCCVLDTSILRLASTVFDSHRSMASCHVAAIRIVPSRLSPTYAAPYLHVPYRRSCPKPMYLDRPEREAECPCRLRCAVSPSFDTRSSVRQSVSPLETDGPSWAVCEDYSRRASHEISLRCLSASTLVAPRYFSCKEKGW